jgi:DNA-binding transcriptional LysR family regulator
MSATPVSDHTRSSAGLERWFGIEVRHLVALVAVDDARSFRLAAEELGYVQSAVSQQIAMLERLLGTRLVERERGRARVTMTPPGERLVAAARRILAELEAGCTEARRLSDGSAGTLRLGISQDLAPRLLPGMLRALARFQTELLCHEAPTVTELCEQVHGGRLDVGIAELPLLEGPFRSAPVLSDPTVLVVPAAAGSVPIATRHTVDEIAQLELIAYDGWRMMPLIGERLKLTGRRPRWTLRSLTAAGVQALVGAGLGAALMPRLAVDAEDPRVQTIELVELPARQIVAFWHNEREHGDALAAAISAVQSAARELTAPQPRARGALPSGAACASIGPLAA